MYNRINELKESQIYQIDLQTTLKTEREVNELIEKMKTLLDDTNGGVEYSVLKPYYIARLKILNKGLKIECLIYELIVLEVKYDEDIKKLYTYEKTDLETCVNDIAQVIKKNESILNTFIDFLYFTYTNKFNTKIQQLCKYFDITKYYIYMQPKKYDDDRNEYFINQYLLLMKMTNLEAQNYSDKITYLKQYVQNKKNYVEVYNFIKSVDLTLIKFLNIAFEKHKAAETIQNKWRTAVAKAAAKAEAAARAAAKAEAETAAETADETATAAAAVWGAAAADSVAAVEDADTILLVEVFNEMKQMKQMKTNGTEIIQFKSFQIESFQKYLKSFFFKEDLKNALQFYKKEITKHLLEKKKKQLFEEYILNCNNDTANKKKEYIFKSFKLWLCGVLNTKNISNDLMSISPSSTFDNGFPMIMLLRIITLKFIKPEMSSNIKDILPIEISENVDIDIERFELYNNNELMDEDKFFTYLENNAIDTNILNRFIDDMHAEDLDNPFSGGQNIIVKQNYDYYLSSRSINMLQNLGIFNIVKFIRFSYYNNSTKNEIIESIIFKDYLVTVIISVVLHSLRLNKLSIGIIIDQIISMAMYYKYKNVKYLLLPYYFIFI